MSGDKKLICFIAICIIFLATVLLIRIKTNQGYDYKLYNEIYSEYESIFDGDIDSTFNNDYTNESQYTIVHKNRDLTSNEKDVNNIDKVIGKIIIPKINIEYPIIKETTSEYLKIAPTKYCGPEINEVR